MALATFQFRSLFAHRWRSYVGIAVLLGLLKGRFFDQDRFTATHGRRPDPNRAGIACPARAARRVRPSLVLRSE